MTEEQKEKVRGHFNKKSKREQLKTLEVLSEPWIQNGALTENAKTLDEIFALADKSYSAKRKAADKINGKSHLTPPKKKRKK